MHLSGMNSDWSFHEIRSAIKTGRGPDRRRKEAHKKGSFQLELGLAYTEFAKKVCPRLRDSACWRSGEITQPKTNFFGQLCMYIVKAPEPVVDCLF